MIHTSAEKIYEEYLAAKRYNASIDLNERVRQNENFFMGKQWEGVNAPDIDKPVFNILKRVVNYFIAMLASDNIGVSIKSFNSREDEKDIILNSALKEQIDLIMEDNRYSQLMRNMLRDAAVDGDGCVHVYYEPTHEGIDGIPGRVACELIANTDVFFADTCENDVRRQPYIIISSRRNALDVREEMRKNGINPAISAEVGDEDEKETIRANEKRCTVLTKYYKKDGRVWFVKTVKDAVVKKPVCTGLREYPVVYMNWERVKGSYHGVGAIEGLIPNQISINKMAAMAQQFIRQQAFPRVFYNRNKLKSWQGGIKPVAVSGDPSDIVYTDRHGISMSAQVSEYIDKFIGHTKDLMGASDAALGNIIPENTSAIIAVQKATAIPLELIRQEYYRFTEDFVRTCIDIMGAYYGYRRTAVETAEGFKEEYIDFSKFDGRGLKLNIDIGAAAYWNEMTAATTLDNLYKEGLISSVTYLEGMPKSALPNKSKMIEEAKERKDETDEGRDEN